MQHHTILAQQIFELIGALRNAPVGEPTPESVAEGQSYHRGRIEALIGRGVPIELVLPAFPAKSANREKTMGDMPDLGDAWSNLVAREFPDAIRLSIHPQPAHSRKLGVRLVPSPNAWRRPWHAAVVFDGRAYSLCGARTRRRWAPCPRWRRVATRTS